LLKPLSLDSLCPTFSLSFSLASFLLKSLPPRPAQSHVLSLAFLNPWCSDLHYPTFSLAFLKPMYKALGAEFLSNPL
jgi:hypothetical protein